MKATIQCAGRKQPDAASLCLNGERLAFVAKPDLGEECQVRPWDKVPGMTATWIDCVRAVNELKGSYAWCDFQAAGVSVEAGWAQMYKAGLLYQPSEYQRLVEAFGIQNVYILSAGWGLVNGERLLPDYDITFSTAVRESNKYITPSKRSTKASLDRHIVGADPIHLFITPKYLDYWSHTFAATFEDRDISLHWHRSKHSRYPVVVYDCGGRRTNWHYTAVKQFIERM